MRMQDISEGIFAEWCKVHDNFYGTHMGKMQEIIDRNRVVCLLIKICLLDIDVQGTKKIQKVIKTNNIWLDVPSLKVLEERLRGRSTDSEEVIIKRINNATEEIKQAHDCEFYSFIVNDKWENTEQQVLEHLRKWYPGAGL
jgi:guanylate kinase